VEAATRDGARIGNMRSCVMTESDSLIGALEPGPQASRESRCTFPPRRQETRTSRRLRPSIRSRRLRRGSGTIVLPDGSAHRTGDPRSERPPRSASLPDSPPRLKL
jgi:hypothetical protein